MTRTFTSHADELAAAGVIPSADDLLAANAELPANVQVMEMPVEGASQKASDIHVARTANS